MEWMDRGTDEKTVRHILASFGEPCYRDEIVLLHQLLQLPVVHLRYLRADGGEQLEQQKHEQHLALTRQHRASIWQLSTFTISPGLTGPKT